MDPCPPPEDGEVIPQLLWDYEDIVIDTAPDRPANRRGLGSMLPDKQPRIIAYFDGACKSKLGAGGYVVYDARGQVLSAAGCFFGENARTNNEAEIMAAS